MTPPSTSQAFTEYVRVDRPTDQETLEALAALERLIARELRRRGLWQHSPRLLGYHEEHWTPGLLREVACDGFEFAVLRRLFSLRHQLSAKTDIEGLVLRNIRAFLSELQRRHDPIGHAVFSNLRGALELARQQGEVDYVGGVTANDALYRRPGSESSPASGAEIERHLGAFPADRLRALARAGVRNQLWLLDQIRILLASGVEAFQFKDLVDCLKRHVRLLCEPFEAPLPLDDACRLRSLHASPEEMAISAETFSDTGATLRSQIEALGCRRKVRDGMLRILEELEARARDGLELPSQAELARQLDIATSTFNEYWNRLRSLCAERKSG